VALYKIFLQPNPGNPVPTTGYPVPKPGNKSTHYRVIYIMQITDNANIRKSVLSGSYWTILAWHRAHRTVKQQKYTVFQKK